MAIPKVPQAPPQSIPPLDNRGGDATLPALFSRTWWLFLNAVSDLLSTLATEIQAFEALDFVFGGSKLTVGVIPKAAALKALTDSAISDDGTKITITRTIAGAAQPNLVLDDGVTVSKNRVARYIAGERMDISLNLSYDGSNYNVDDAGKVGTLIYLSPGQVDFYSAASTGPHAAVTLMAQIVAGGFDAPSAYKVAGTQVVGPRGAAITSPSGGGTVVSAPAGGATIDVQARAAIASIISAIAAGGNTVDPVARTAIDAIRARLAAHGLTS